MNLKIKNNFITNQEADIIAASFCTPVQKEIENIHIKSINDKTNGWTMLCDLTQTPESQTVSKFQGDSTVVQGVPEIFHEIAKRIADELEISSTHVFFQYINLGANGKVGKHYDAGIPGFITYKCNICVKGPENDFIMVGGDKVEFTPGDLYCFEANLYKHWMESSDSPRIHLSYGFLLPYNDLGWNEESPRVKMSNRIWKSYQMV